MIGGHAAKWADASVSWPFPVTPILVSLELDVSYTNTAAQGGMRLNAGAWLFVTQCLQVCSSGQFRACLLTWSIFSAQKSPLSISSCQIRILSIPGSRTRCSHRLLETCP